MTVIELIAVVVLGSMVLLPLLGLVNQIVKRQPPTAESSNASKDLRLFRGRLAEDWAEARVIKIGVDAQDVECNGGTKQAGPGSPNVTGPLIAMQSSDRLRRIIYNLYTDPVSGRKDIYRRECGHNPSFPADPKVDTWGYGQHISSGGSEQLVVADVRSISLPATCNVKANFPKYPPLAPYEPCDMNVSLVMRDGQRTTIRMYQHVGRKS